jgi:uncharacterized protein DUF4189
MTNTASESPDRPPESLAPQKKQKKRKWHVATWLALASAATAIVAAGISADQVNVAAAQNTVAEQEQLVTITTTIAQQLAQGQAPGIQSAASQGLATLLGPLVQVQAESDASQVVIAELTADGQAAAVLINGLHGEGIAGIEYVEVANALAAGGDMAQALTFYNDAVSAPPGDVVTRANALRNEASVYYSLGQNGLAHQDMMQAARLFAGHVVLTQSLIERSIAQAYLADSYYQISIQGCGLAVADLQAALGAVKQLGPNSSVDPTLQALADHDETAVAGLQSSGGCAAAAHGPGDYGAWAWSEGDRPHSIASGLGHTLTQAETAAVRACEAAGGGSGGSGGCYAHEWFENAYSSFAYDATSGDWGFSWTKTRARADPLALAACSRQIGAKDCAIVGRAQTLNPTGPARGGGV